MPKNSFITDSVRTEMCKLLKKRYFLAVIAMVIFAAALSQAENSSTRIYVSSTGNDATGNGTISAPYQHIRGGLAKLGSNAGDVTIVVSTDTSEGTLKVPADKGLTSLTITTENPRGVQIGGASIFASGVPLTFEKGITVAADVYGGFYGTSTLRDKQNISLTINGTATKDVYGGSGIYETLTSLGSSSINLTFGEDSLVYGNIYGGGKNANTGNAEHPIPVNITLNGSVANSNSSQYNTKTHMICGGSYLLPSTPEPKQQYGDVNITVKEKAFLANKNQNAVNIIGGGRSVGVNTHNFTLFGNVNIDIMSADRDSEIYSVSGGGYIEGSENPGSSLVSGDITITSRRSAARINGGGRVQGDWWKNGSMNACVSGDVTINLYKGSYTYIAGGGSMPELGSVIGNKQYEPAADANVSGLAVINIHEGASPQYVVGGGFAAVPALNCKADVEGSEINYIESGESSEGLANEETYCSGWANFQQNRCGILGDAVVKIRGDGTSGKTYKWALYAGGAGNGDQTISGSKTAIFESLKNDFCGNLDAFDKIIVNGGSNFAMSSDKTIGGASTDLTIENSKLTLGGASFKSVSAVSGDKNVLRITQDTTVTGELEIKGALEIADGATLTANSLTAYGSITFKGTGKINVTGTVSGDVIMHLPADTELKDRFTYGGGTIKTDVAIEVRELKLTNAKLILAPGEERDLIAAVFPKNATLKKITWSTTAANIVSADQNGHVAAIGEGKAVVTAKIDGTELSSDCQIEVKTPNIEVRSVQISPKPLTLTSGDKAQMAAKVTPQNATNPNISYKSSNSDIVSVDASGKVEALKAGEAVVTVTADGKSDSVNIVVMPAPEKIILVSEIKLTPTKIVTAIGKKTAVSAQAAPENATNKTLTWSCDKAVEITAITNSGCEITAHKAGEYTLTATANDGSGKNEACTIKVIDERLQITASLDVKSINASTEVPQTVPATQSTDIIGSLIADKKLEGSEGSGFTISESAAKKAAEDHGVKPETIIPLQTVAGIIDSTEKKTAILAFAIAGGNMPEEAKTFSDLAILKLTTNGDFVPLIQVENEAELVQGMYMIKKGSETVTQATSTDRGETYTLCIAVDDNGNFDYDSTKGSVVDTPAIGVKSEPAAPTQPNSSTNNGCSTGFGITALLAAFPMLIFRKRHKH